MSQEPRAPSFAICESLANFDTATVSNAIEVLEVRDRTEGYASNEIRCQFPALKPLVGYAITCTLDNAPGARRPTQLPELIRLVETGPKPAVVVCQFVGSDRSRACLGGDMFTALLQRLGAVGLVTDAPNRDLQTIQERSPGFQVFGNGAVASHGNGTIVDVNVPIVVGGLRIQPGDLIHGDVNGVISIPSDIAEQVVEHAMLVRKDEQEVFDLIADRTASIELVKARFLQ